MLQDQARVPPARLQIAKASRPLLCRAPVPIGRFRKIVQNKSGFGQRCELPVRVAFRIFNLLLALSANFFSQLLRTLRLTDQEIHGRGIDP